MKTINFLGVGNSFSQDTLRYLHDIAKAGGMDVHVVNLYIGGCPLMQHWNNVLSGAEDYLYEIDGESTGRYVSVAAAVDELPWDYIMTQQASHDSGMWETYQPYLENLVGWFREKRPGAKLLMQKTWAYETDSTHGAFELYGRDQDTMYERLSGCYGRASELVNVPLIPIADVVQAVRARDPFRYGAGGMSLCRDGFHLHYVYGRYLAAATVYAYVFNGDVVNNSFVPDGADIGALEVIKMAVDEVVNA